MIDDIHSLNFLQERATKIKEFIHKFRLRNAPSIIHMGIMSWALVNEHDKKRLWIDSQWKRMREIIERFFELEFRDDLIFTIENWWEAVEKENLITFMNQSDFLDFANKENVLFWLRNSKLLPTGRIFLFDDVVSHNTKITTPKREITFINSKEL